MRAVSCDLITFKIIQETAIVLMYKKIVVYIVIGDTHCRCTKYDHCVS